MLSSNELHALYVEYDNMYIGNNGKKNYSKRLFGPNVSKEKKSENAKSIVVYALKTYLGWRPNVLAARLDDAIVDKLKLRRLLDHIKMPIECDAKVNGNIKTKDYFYLVSLVSDGGRIGARRRTLHLYEQILSGEVTKFPKEYFFGTAGVLRSCFCLQYQINEHYAYLDSKELYLMAATTKEWASFIEESRLKIVQRDLYGSNPVEFLHTALPNEYKDDFIYHYASFLFYEGRKRLPPVKTTKAEYVF